VVNLNVNREPDKPDKQLQVENPQRLFMEHERDESAAPASDAPTNNSDREIATIRWLMKHKRFM
jgi:hypothetical protein